MRKRRVTILVLDSFGIGAAEDADRFGDDGADTLGHIAAHCVGAQRGPLSLPNLARLGLFHAHAESTGAFAPGSDSSLTPIAGYGHAAELSSGKDTPSGHWEMAGVPVLFEWGYFPQCEGCFPGELIENLIQEAGLPGVLGECHGSGTLMLDRFGEQHIASGKPIVYTSGDSVFQIAAHEAHFGVEHLYEVCEIARKLVDEFNIGRVIARPFVGAQTGKFQRTGNRRDYSVPPPAPTVLDKLVDAGGSVISIGKIADIFAHRGITEKIKATGIQALFDASLGAQHSAPDNSIVFTNFVDFDSSFGHRRDVPGYANALEEFDHRLPELLAQLRGDDILVITADHGCDPTWPGSDHTREYIPVLVYGQPIAAGSLGRRETFADIGQSLAGYFKLPAMQYGTSFF